MKKTPTKKSPETANNPAIAAKPAGKKATIYDLARLANVSPGTVSRVLNNRDRVKAETRESVLQAAAALNLKPQASVRAREIVILSEPTYPDRFGGYSATLTAHLSYAFSKRNIGVLLPSNPFEELPTKFFDGIVVVTQDKALRELVADLEKRMPVVHIDKFPVDPAEYIVCSDHYKAGYMAARHFIERGKKRPAFLGGNYFPFAERLRGFRKALTEANLPIDEQLASLFGPESNHVSVVTRIVRAGADSIYAPGSSFEALECLHILSYVMGLKVPQEISLIGGENERVSSLLNPPLTTIEEPLKEMAEQAVAMLDRLTSGEQVAKRNVMLPIRLIDRNSVS
ncbi:MAG TPA: LacI family DNA-binding transcriptional regulator [Candidatus Didemnitutus sp.]|nr:LacI family DNA-binding transcriptional regulator [Candidatus Didemnitutus sp.]